MILWSTDIDRYKVRVIQINTMIDGAPWSMIKFWCDNKATLRFTISNQKRVASILEWCEWGRAAGSGSCGNEKRVGGRSRGRGHLTMARLVHNAAPSRPTSLRVYCATHGHAHLVPCCMTAVTHRRRWPAKAFHTKQTFIFKPDARNYIHYSVITSITGTSMFKVIKLYKQIIITVTS